MKWMPIESAPKEKGARILALLPSGRVVTAISSYISVFEPKPGGGHKVIDVRWDHYAEDRGDAYIPQSPTHWMPLPPKPDKNCSLV